MSARGSAAGVAPTGGRDGPTCVTCSDRASTVRVVELLAGRMARVTDGERHELVSVALVSVEAGDTVLVHAGEALAMVVGP